MRTIAELDIKNDFVIKGINFEGLRKIGKPVELSAKYYAEGVDELLLMGLRCNIVFKRELI